MNQMKGSLKRATAVLLSALMITSTLAVSGTVTAGAINTNTALSQNDDDFKSGKNFEYNGYTCRYDSTDNGIVIVKGPTDVANVTLPYRIKGYPIVNIAGTAFENNKALKSISLPSGVKYIYANAFKGCTNLESVTLPSTLKEIFSSVFEGCSSLKSISIPDSVEYIGYGVFENCTSLMDIKVPDNAVKYDSNIFENTAWYNSQPDGVVYLDNLLYNYKGVLPENYVLTIKEGTKNIASRAFYHEYKHEIQSSNLVAIEMPDSLLCIGANSFSGCENITSLEFPDSVQFIDSSAFSACNNISDIKWPSGLKSIGYNSFIGCNSIEEVILPDGVEEIGYGAFKKCQSLKTVVMPDSVTTLEPEAFSACPVLESVRLSENLTCIDGYTFEKCDNLKEINIPKNVDTIKVCAFYKCSSLEKLVLPDTLKIIEGSAFQQCDKLANLTIPSSVEQVGAGAFLGTPWLAAKPDGIVYINNVLYTYNGEPEKIDVLNIKDGTTYISDYALQYFKYVKKVTMPDTVTYIGKHAFENCDAMEEIKLSKNITVIKYESFAYCDSLKSIVIPEGVIELEAYCFDGCTSLESLYLPKSLKKINYFVRASDGVLKDLYYAGSEADLDAIYYTTSNMDELKNNGYTTFHYNYVYEEPTEGPTTPPTEKPTEGPTEKPTEAPTAPPTEIETEKPTEAPTQPPVTVNTMYFVPSSNWKNNNARFAAYYFNGSKESTWVSLTATSDGKYSCTIPTGDYKSVIFTRMNPATTDNNWDNGTKWNQTADLTIGGNCFTLTSTDWDNGNGTWTTIENPTVAPTQKPSENPSETPTVAPTQPPVAENTLYFTPSTNWTEANARFSAYFFNGSNASTWVSLTKNSDGKYSCTIPAGNYKSVIFVRMNPNTTDNNWDYTNKWNQTADLTIDGNHFTLTSTAWDNGTGTWTKIENPTTVPTEKPTDKPTDKPTEKPSETPTVAPTQPPVTENTLYFTPSTNWTESNARFSAYFFDGTSESTWVSLTKGSDGKYSCTIPAGNYKSVIFVRMNPNTTDNNWESVNKWNQTADLTIDGNHFTLTSTAWDNGTGTWTKIENPTTVPTEKPSETPTTQPPVAENAIYFVPSANWKDANARFAAYFFDGNGKEEWISLTATSDGKFVGSMPTGFTNVIFTRMNPTTTDNNWENGVKWNQTADLKIEGNCFTLAEGVWDNGNGTWTTIVEPTQPVTT
ncbi:MAG: leucine-rich repeat protein, partial [Acutalibacteraceae bacterium]|nr:leucine-rich repeat protein [Acutalibacteraceae bacterium]